MEAKNRRVLASCFIIGLLALGLGWGTHSWFSDTETSKDNYFVAGTMDLEVNGEDPLVSRVVSLTDMKPCEWAYVTVTLKNVGDNDGSAWMHIFNVRGENYIETDAEVKAGGETVNDIYNWITFDLKVGSTVVIIDPNDDIKLGDIYCVWIPLGGLAKGVTITLTLSFHLQPETDNRYQGDRCLFDIEFLLNQVGAPDPRSNRILLENKDPTTWRPIIGDGIWGIAEYKVGSLTLDVEAHGLTPNTDYQIKITSPEVASWYPVDETTRRKMASALASGLYDATGGTAPPSGYNLYERGYYDISAGGNLFAGPPTWQDDIVGVWAFTKNGATNLGVKTDANGYFSATRTASLPSGEYSFIKLVVSLDDSPWTPKLMECWTPLFFTIP